MEQFKELSGTNNPFGIPIQLRLADTDSVGHINNAAYIKFMETARTEWHASVRGSRESLKHWDWILGEIRLRFKKEGYLSDVLRIEMWASKIGTKSWDFSYLIINQNDEVLAIAQTTQISYDYNNRMSQPIKEDILNDLQSRLGNVLEEFA